MTTTRPAYRIVLRRIYTGCDYIVRLHLSDESLAFERAKRYVPLRERNGLRLVSCTALTSAEIVAWRKERDARLAALGI